MHWPLMPADQLMQAHSSLGPCLLLVSCPSPLPAFAPPYGLPFDLPQKAAGISSTAFSTTACALHAYCLIHGVSHACHSFSHASTITLSNLLLWVAALPCKAQSPRDCQHPQVPFYQGQPGISFIHSTPQA